MKSTNGYRHVLASFHSTPFAILPAKLAEIEAVILRHVRGEIVQLEQKDVKKPAAAYKTPDGGNATQNESGYYLVGNVAVIPISGTISPRASAFDDWSGGTSHESIGRATDAAAADGKAEAIVYDIDSPGGSVFGQEETAPKIVAAGKIKPTTGVANYMAASAAYWYLSQCGEAICSPSGMVGCIGCIMANMDATEAYKQAGLRHDLIANDSSPFKTEGYPQTQVTPESLADLKAMCNAYSQTFIQAVAKGRGVKPPTVERDFGKGRTLLAQPALDARMIDGIDTFENVMAKLHKANSRQSRRNVAAQMVANRLPTA